MKEGKMPLNMKHIVWLKLRLQWRYLTDKTGFLFSGTHSIDEKNVAQIVLIITEHFPSRSLKIYYCASTEEIFLFIQYCHLDKWYVNSLTIFVFVYVSDYIYILTSCKFDSKATPVFDRHQFFGTSEHYGKAHGSLFGWMNRIHVITLHVAGFLYPVIF